MLSFEDILLTNWVIYPMWSGLLHSIFQIAVDSNFPFQIHSVIIRSEIKRKKNNRTNPLDMALLSTPPGYENNELNRTFASHCLPNNSNEEPLSDNITQAKPTDERVLAVGHVSAGPEKTHTLFNVNYPYYAQPNRTMHIKSITFYRLPNQIRRTHTRIHTLRATRTRAIYTHARTSDRGETGWEARGE